MEPLTMLSSVPETQEIVFQGSLDGKKGPGEVGGNGNKIIFSFIAISFEH